MRFFLGLAPYEYTWITGGITKHIVPLALSFKTAEKATTTEPFRKINAFSFIQM